VKREETKQKSRTRHRVIFDWPYFGVHKGDVLTVEATKDVKPGQLILIEDDEDESRRYFHRVCCTNGESVRVTNDTNKPHDENLSLIIGKVVDISHEDCNHAKIKTLRAQIAKLQSDTDAWANTTQIYELEKEIYALENPPEEVEEDETEWPEVICDE